MEEADDGGTNHCQRLLLLRLLSPPSRSLLLLLLRLLLRSLLRLRLRLLRRSRLEPLAPLSLSRSLSRSLSLSLSRSRERERERLRSLLIYDCTRLGDEEGATKRAKRTGAALRGSD